MKVHTNNPSRPYGNPRKARKPTAAERRGLEMVQGCRTMQEKSGRRDQRGAGQWQR